MRALSWHLREGLGEGDDLDEESCELILDLILRERPDVVALQELSGWTRERLFDLAEEAELSSALFFESPSGAHHGVLSRTPLSAGRPLFASASTPTAAFAAETRNLTLVSAYLTPSSADESVQGAEQLMRALPRQRTLLLGDFSVVRREERTPSLDAALPADLAERFPSTSATAVDALVQAGFVDAGESSELGTSLLFGPAGEPLELRLEYALHTPGIEVRSLRVLEGEHLRRASDHLPLLLEITL